MTRSLPIDAVSSLYGEIIPKYYDLLYKHNMLVLPPIGRKSSSSSPTQSKTPVLYVKVPIPEPKTEFTDVPQVDETGKRLECLCFLNNEGKRDGEYTQWYRPVHIVYEYRFDHISQVRRKIHYLQGKRHGKYIKYHPNGVIQHERMYHSGLLNGEFTAYHDNGQLFWQVLYVDGKRQGFMKRYNKEGVLLGTEQYYNDIQVGEYRVYMD